MNFSGSDSNATSDLFRLIPFKNYLIYIKNFLEFTICILFVV